MDNGASSYLRFLSGDRDGLTEIIRDYRCGLVLYLRTIVGNICTAEELAEDTFIKLYVSKPRFNGKCSFKTWLYTIGRFTAVDYIRKNTRVSESTCDDFYALSDEQDIEREYIAEEQKIALHRAIDRLSPDYAQVLYLTYFEDCDTSEAAAIMGKRNRQIVDLLYRAKSSLKAELEKEGFEYEGSL